MNISAYILLGVVAFLILKLLLPNASKRFLKLQASLPTSKIRSIAKGLAEVEGKLLMKTPLFSPIKMTPCIGYYYLIEKIDRDKEGHNSYSTIHEETQCNPFEIEDTTGKIEVVPEGIQLFLMENTHQYTSGGKRYSESLLREGDEVLLIGYADTKGGVPLEQIPTPIAVFLIYMCYYYLINYIYFITMNTSIIAIVLAVLLGASIIGFLITLYNRLVMLRFNLDKAYKNIDVLLKQRADEIPNLVTIAKEFANHEKKLLTELTELRTAYYSAQHTEEKTQISNKISKGLASFFAISEQYPTLSSNSHFAALQTRVSQLEDKLADRREFFNDSVNLYNIGIHEFPNLIVAKILGYKDKTLLEISPSEKQYDGVRF